MNKLSVFLFGIALTLNACENEDDSIKPSNTNSELLSQIKEDLDGYKIAFGDTKKSI